MKPSRGRSGEIVNATMMEVFIVLSFMFMVYSTIVRDNSEAAIRSLVSEKELLQAKIEELRRNVETLTGKRDELQARLDYFFPPYCAGYTRRGAPYGTMTLLPGGAIRVDVPVPFRPGDVSGRQTMTTETFRAAFSGLRAYTREQKCRLAVRVVRETTELSEYLPAQRVVEDVFYSYGELD